MPRYLNDEYNYIYDTCYLSYNNNFFLPNPFSFFSLVNDVDVRCFKFDHYGQEFIKKQKLSPDAWIQISFQLTHYRCGYSYYMLM